MVATVDFARENDLRLVVKGGGHGYQGTSSSADSLLIWTRRMNAITLHDAFVGARNDFPADILPWLGLRRRGVRVRQLEPAAHMIQADELLAALGPRTRLVCLTWVHSFSGWTVDIEALGEICRSRGVIFVVNASQALGAQSASSIGRDREAAGAAG